jgi:hypothetical protein
LKILDKTPVVGFNRVCDVFLAESARFASVGSSEL